MVIIINSYNRSIKGNYLKLFFKHSSTIIFYRFHSSRILISLTTGWRKRYYCRTMHEAKCYLYFYLLVILTTNSCHYSVVHVIIQFAFFHQSTWQSFAIMFTRLLSIFSQACLGSWLIMPVPSNLAILSQGIASPRLVVQS